MAHNKCIRFSLQLDTRTSIENKHFKKINWLKTPDRFKQILNCSAFYFFHKSCPAFMNEIFDIAQKCNISTRQSYCRLRQPLRKTNSGQNALSFLESGEWNKLPSSVKQAANINTFKHKVKEHFFNQIENLSFDN